MGGKGLEQDLGRLQVGVLVVELEVLLCRVVRVGDPSVHELRGGCDLPQLLHLRRRQKIGDFLEHRVASSSGDPITAATLLASLKPCCRVWVRNDREPSSGWTGMKRSGRR